MCRADVTLHVISRSVGLTSHWRRRVSGSQTAGRSYAEILAEQQAAARAEAAAREEQQRREEARRDTIAINLNKMVRAGRGGVGWEMGGVGQGGGMGAAAAPRGGTTRHHRHQPQQDGAGGAGQEGEGWGRAG